MRLLYGVLGVLLLALAVLGVRAWQVPGASSATPAVVSSDGAGAPISPPSDEPSTAASNEPPPTTPSPPVTAMTPPTRPPTPRSAPLRGMVIALDPGHNGANGAHPAQIARLVDAGGFRKACNTTGTATNDGYPEARFTWELAQRLRAALTTRGAQVRMTRTDNAGWGPCVDARGEFGARVGAKVELSLHADGAPAGGHGFHVISPAEKVGYTDDILPASTRLASTIRDTLVGAGFTPSTYLGVNGLDVRGDLGTLNRADVATAMIECGNLRNPGDATLLRSAAGQTRLADGLADALTRYLTETS